MNPVTVSIPQFWLYQAAFFLQLVAVILFFVYAAEPRRGFSLAARTSLTAAVILQGVFLVFLGVAQGGLPLASGFGALCFWSLDLAVLVLWAEWRHKLGLLGAFLAPLSALMLLMGFRFARVSSQATPGLAELWLALHVALAMFSYACFTVAAGTAAAYLVQARQLKRKQMSRWLYQLPPLNDIEALASAFALIGSAALGISLAAGFIWERKLGLAPTFADPKVLFNIFLWLAYAGTSIMRRRFALRGRRYAFILLLLFVLVFFGYYLVNLYFGGHEFLTPAVGA